jgi:hypothetical protein
MTHFHAAGGAGSYSRSSAHRRAEGILSRWTRVGATAASTPGLRRVRPDYCLLRSLSLRTLTLGAPAWLLKAPFRRQLSRS